jgi:transcriptional regulator with XRE-family HTH domain
MSRQVNTTSSDVPERGTFAARLNEALGNTTSESFARRINRTLRTVQRWRAGESQPSGADLVVIARSLGREAAWFYEPQETAA